MEGDGEGGNEDKNYVYWVHQVVERYMKDLNEKGIGVAMGSGDNLL